MVDLSRSLFNPRKVSLPGELLLIPQFWDKAYYSKLKEEADYTFNLLLSEVLVFEHFSLLAGFLGYPQLLTLLEFIRRVREKEVYFLGTAGSLDPHIDRPMILNAVDISSTAILTHFDPQPGYDLKPFPNGAFRPVRGVTVDIIQRETPGWLKEQVAAGIDFVEMELFPLRAFLGKPFTALLVASDLLAEDGITLFPDRDDLNREFIAAYEAIVRCIHERKSDPDPPIPA